MKHKLQTNYRRLGTMCWVICRPRTPYTSELLSYIDTTLDKHAESLKKFPAPEARCCTEGQRSGQYPLRWLEIMGEICHPLMLKYNKHLVLDEKMDAIPSNYI